MNYDIKFQGYGRIKPRDVLDVFELINYINNTDIDIKDICCSFNIKTQEEANILIEAFDKIKDLRLNNILEKIVIDQHYDFKDCSIKINTDGSHEADVIKRIIINDVNEIKDKWIIQ